MKKGQNEEDLKIKEFLEEMIEYQISMIPEQKVLNEKYSLSDSFFQKMEHLIQNQAKKSDLRKYFKWIGAAAAALLIIFLIVNPAYITKAANRVIHWFEDHVLFQFEEDTDINQTPRYQIKFVPEGYTLAEDVYYTNAGMIEYHNEKGERINLLYGVIDSALNVDHEEKDFLILKDRKGQEIYYLKGSDQESSLTWYSKDRTTVFNLSGNLTEEELFKLYSSVIIAED